MRDSALLISCVLVGTTGLAAADSFGGWSYTPPPGYTTTSSDDHVELTKLDKESFCSISIFEVRQATSSVAVESAYEWQNVVTPTFTAKITRRAKLTTTRGAEIAATKATLTTAAGARYVGIHYAVMPPGLIGSVLLISSSAADLRRCERVGTGVVRSLDVDWSSPTLAADPEARAETPEGRWASAGSTNREYTFAAAGYRFHSETITGDRIRVIDETGSYTVRGNQLVLTPQTATTATIREGVAKRSNVTLEKTTYTWARRYEPETDTWRIVLTPGKATARDGDLRAGGYSYSDRVKPAWKFAREPAI